MLWKLLKSCFLKNRENTKKMTFFRSSMIHNDTFLMQTFFKLWHVSKSFIQNLTSCISFLQNLTIVNFLTSSFAFRRSSENSENVVSRSNVFQYVFSERWFFWILKRFGRFFQNFETFQIFFPKHWSRQIPNAKPCFSKKHKKLKICRFYDVK